MTCEAQQKFTDGSVAGFIAREGALGWHVIHVPPGKDAAETQAHQFATVQNRFYAPFSGRAA